MVLRLLQWNCMYSEDVQKVVELIKELDPDIVCLQELTQGYDQRWDDTGAYIARFLGYDAQYQYGRMILPDGKPALMGNGIFSRFPLFGKRVVQLSRRNAEVGGDIHDDRYYLQADVVLPGRAAGTLTVGTVHLPFHPQFKTTPLASGMVAAILETVPQTGSVILMGDLNRTPNTRVARQLRQAGLRNIGPPLNQPTWTTKPFTIGPWQYDSLQWRLDCLLGRGDVRRRQARVVQTSLSDHLPIMAEIELPD